MADFHYKPTVAVVGGGPAGLAAAVAACRRGLHVELFEQRKTLGGRAGSFHDPSTGELIDYCRHVSMGCCTALTEFRRQTGTDDCFRTYRQMHFIGPDGIQYNLAPSRLLPAPLHLLPGLMRLGYLTLSERVGIALAVRQLSRAQVDDDRQSIGTWLRQHGQSERAIERFWSVVLVSALGDTVERLSLSAARKVFVDGFMASRRACELEVPQAPLGEIFDRRVGTWLAEHGVAVHRGVKIERIDGDASRAAAVVLPDGTRRRFDFIIAAVPWRHVRSLFPPAMLEAMPELEHIKDIRSSPITAVHLWFDRPITTLPHAVLVGRTNQWLFRGWGLGAGGWGQGIGDWGTGIKKERGERREERNQRRINTAAKFTSPLPSSLFPLLSSLAPSPQPPAPICYFQVVISASHDLVGRSRESITDEVCAELGEIFPDARPARLLHSRVVTQPSAVFSAMPGSDRLRPAQHTPIENLRLAGDWTATGWPATMEGAVRSGYMAAEGGRW